MCNIYKLESLYSNAFNKWDSWFKGSTIAKLRYLFALSSNLDNIEIDAGICPVSNLKIAY